MSRYVATDIRDKIIDLLQNGGVDGQGKTRDPFITCLTTIDTARSMTTPTPQLEDITYDWGDNQYPWILVDVTSSETQLEEETLQGGYDYDVATEIYNTEITMFIKDNSNVKKINNVYNYVENYIEGINKVLYGYCDDNITWVLLTLTQRSELYKREKETMKMATLTYEIRIN